MANVVPSLNGKPIYKIYGHEDKNKSYDVIIIGTGMGGMSCASALAHYGKRVLMLEQHYLPGGFTHMFTRKGYQWDVGVHVVGEMTKKNVPGKMLHWLSDGQLKMNPMGNPYDSFYFPDGYKIGLPDNKKELLEKLKQDFPKETDKIDHYFKIVKKVAAYSSFFFLFKSLPRNIAVTGEKILHLFAKDWWSMTSKEVMDEIGLSEKLQTIITSQWGYIGSTPEESSFPSQALIHQHFMYGAYYPEGGSKAIAESLLKVVLNAGGDVVTRASVKEIIIENDMAVGVRMQDDREFRAPTIVSAAGAKNSLKLLSDPKYQQSPWAQAIKGVKDSPSYICLHMGFKGPIHQHGAGKCNKWFNSSWRPNALWKIKDPKDPAPILYVSFPSFKDPNHDPGEEQVHTGECITFVDWHDFDSWQGSSKRTRPEDYKELKSMIEKRLIEELKHYMPEIMQYLDFAELSTPLTTKHYVAAGRGAIYGLEATPHRYKCDHLRTRTPIKNYYMTGVDSVSLGVAGAMTSGILTASSIHLPIYKHLVFP